MEQNGKVPKLIGKIEIAVFENDVHAQSSLDGLQTMQAIGVAMAKLAAIYRQKDEQKIQPAPPGLIVPRG